MSSINRLDYYRFEWTSTQHDGEDTIMEPEPVGRVLTEAKIENLMDLWDAKRGLLLEHLDFVVELRSRTLIGNPAHGGEHIYELY